MNSALPVSAKPRNRLLTALLAFVAAFGAVAVPATSAQAAGPEVVVYLTCKSSGAYSWKAVGTGFNYNTTYTTWYDTSYREDGGNGGSWDQGEAARMSSGYGTVSSPTYYGNLGSDGIWIEITYHIGTREGKARCTF